MPSQGRRAASLAESTSSSITPASVREQSGRTAGSARSSSGRLHLINGAAFVAVHTTAPLALTNAIVPEMMRQGWGRIVNVTTSLGTMLNAGSPTYGPSKAALEALSAIMAKDLDGTGVTVNVLVPGGVTNTPMISDEAGFDRAKLIRPEVMVPPLLWLVTDAAGKVTGRRFLGIHWDPALPPEQAAEKAGALVAWTSIATMPITPSHS
jgi:NAD(P)-dependent dehydrogenase (short-subunit alcohol dehydrogenase family)